MRIGLVGFGSIAEHGHLPAWRSFPDVEVAAIADIRRSASIGRGIAFRERSSSTHRVL